MYLHKRVCIISKIMCRYLCKTVRFKINFHFFLFCMFCLESLENVKLVLLITLSYKKCVNSTFNADPNTFLADKTMRFFCGLYVLIDARNKISKLFIALCKT